MNKFLVSLMVVALMGCSSASDHRKQVQDDSGNTLTVGTVQREVRIGMSGADVLTVMGSPNIVSTDKDRNEVWVYDKVSSDVTYSQSSGYATLILIGADRNSGSRSATQRNLTVIIKFDEQKQVRDFAYHSSKF